MESEIKIGDLVVVNATNEQLYTIGIRSSRFINMLRLKNKVIDISGNTAVVMGFVINLEYLEKCEQE